MEVTLAFDKVDSAGIEFRVNTRIRPLFPNSEMHVVTVTQLKQGSLRVATFYLDDEFQVGDFMIWLFSSPDIEYDLPKTEQIVIANKLEELYEDNDSGYNFAS